MLINKHENRERSKHCYIRYKLKERTRKKEILKVRNKKMVFPNEVAMKPSVTCTAAVSPHKTNFEIHQYSQKCLYPLSQ